MTRPSKPEGQTFIEEARRKQIIDAALQTIAEQGYTQTSFAEIAKGLGITKGLIAYHFNGKHDLITSAIHTILNRQGAYIKSHVDGKEIASENYRRILAPVLSTSSRTVHTLSRWWIYGEVLHRLKKRRLLAGLLMIRAAHT